MHCRITLWKNRMNVLYTNDRDALDEIYEWRNEVAKEIQDSKHLNLPHLKAAYTSRFRIPDSGFQTCWHNAAFACDGKHAP
jgi:hypothetical protein